MTTETPKQTLEEKKAIYAGKFPSIILDRMLAQMSMETRNVNTVGIEQVIDLSVTEDMPLSVLIANFCCWQCVNESSWFWLRILRLYEEAEMKAHFQNLKDRVDNTPIEPVTEEQIQQVFADESKKLADQIKSIQGWGSAPSTKNVKAIFNS